MKQLQPNERFCFVSDDDGHWYCIPVKFKEEFDQWLESIYTNDVVSFLKLNSFAFGQYRLNMHISNYSFENLKEI